MSAASAEYQRDWDGKTVIDHRDVDPAWTLATGDLFHGTSEHLHQSTPKVQEYLAQRCGKSWDDFCRIAARNRSDRAAFHPEGLANATHGDVFIRKALEARFCRVVGISEFSDGDKQRGYCAQSQEAIDNLVPYSPAVDSYVGDCHLTCDQAEIEKPFDQELLTLALNLEQRKPGAVSVVLDNICATAKSSGKLPGNQLLRDYCGIVPPSAGEAPPVSNNPSNGVLTRLQKSGSEKDGLADIFSTMVKGVLIAALLVIILLLLRRK